MPGYIPNDMPEDVTSRIEQAPAETPAKTYQLLKPSKRDMAIALAAIVFSLGLTVLAFIFRDYLEHIRTTIREIGYPAVFGISLFSSASVFVPLPGPAVAFVGGSVLSPVPVAIVAALG
ncbi:MAG: hypothetical protein AAB369_02645, partial [Chloroflexota bacterium]